MNKNFRLITITQCVIILGITGGCRRVTDIIFPDPANDIRICNINTMTFGSHGLSSEARFYYNKYGSPDSVKFTRAGTGNPNIMIRYDAKHRMTDYIMAYENGGFERWEKFMYDNNDRIISENFYTIGLLDSVPRMYYSSGLTNYEYDQSGRVVKATTQTYTGAPFPAIVEYKYDAAGNLVKPGVTYDNKVNIHRSNKIWMFLDKDYSRNNPFTATEYNALGLPREIVNLPVPTSFLRRTLTQASINYQCDPH